MASRIGTQFVRLGAPLVARAFTSVAKPMDQGALQAGRRFFASKAEEPLNVHGQVAWQHPDRQHLPSSGFIYGFHGTTMDQIKDQLSKGQMTKGKGRVYFTTEAKRALDFGKAKLENEKNKHEYDKLVLLLLKSKAPVNIDETYKTTYWGNNEEPVHIESVIKPHPEYVENCTSGSEDQHYE